MSTKENRSIAYIYNEMDPSEKLEFERDLKNNSDLLIEVESLKKVSKNLNQLESINPPDHVVEAVYQSVKKNKLHTAKGYWKPIMYSAAALLVIGVSSGLFLVSHQYSETNNSQTAESAGITPGGTQIFSQPVNTASEKNLQPWVDKNEVLYFNGQTASENSSVSDSIRNESLKKLTPVDPSGVTSRQRQLQLTGSHN
jgi:hypothetical protein